VRYISKLFFLVVVFVVVPAAVRGQDPAGGEFQVNTYTTSFQGDPAVASDANGDLVVVWASFGPDGSANGIVGRRFNASGLPQASEFQVNSYTTNFQITPAVASAANGDFVVIWASYGEDGSGYGVFGRRFSAAGVPQGGDFEVNSYTTGHQRFFDVASDASGNFVVVWQYATQDGSSYGVFGQRFDAAGTRQGSEFRVNSYTTGIQESPSVAFDGSGSFVVVWQSDVQDGSGFGIFGRRFDAAGVAQGTEFRVNSYTTSNQADPAVASDANGDFVVVWQSNGQDGAGYGIFGQRFSPSGSPQGTEFRVSTYTTAAQFASAVAASGTGSFVVVWQSDVQDGSGGGTFGQRFDSSGVPRGGEFRVNTYTTASQDRTAVAADPDGDFVVVWESNGQDGSGYGIFGQRYGDRIFEDGFESADLTRWSSASTDGLDLSVSGAGAMAGTTAGLQAFVNDTNALFVQDDSPDAENRYRARFYFDTNGFDPGEAQSHFRTRIFIAFDPTGLRLITLVLKRQGGAYSIEGRVRLDDGTRADTGFFPITDGPHFFELDWIRASGPAANDGFFTLRIDNTPVSGLTFLNNDASPVDFVRMGALSIKTGAAGTLYYDQFESRRQVLIGPE
jgi:hypothetical protein